MRAMPALPFAEMHAANSVGNITNGSSSSSNSSTNGLEDDHFGHVAYKLSLLSTTGAVVSNGTDCRDNVENLALAYGPVPQQQQQQQQHNLSVNGTTAASGLAAGPFDDNIRTRRSANMTECVGVPSSEHVAEIVGRQGKRSTFSVFIIFRKNI